LAELRRLEFLTPLLAKPRIDFPLASENVLECFIKDKKNTKGLTISGEEWLRDTVGRFLRWLPVPLSEANREHVVSFLGFYNTKPWRKHAFYRANKSFWKWASRTYDIPNPMIDRWGNAVIEAPKTPKTVLYTMTPEKVHRLLEAASCIRDRAAISLLADSGARRSEIVAIKTNNVDLEKNCIKVMGKGNKEGYLIFGEATKAHILRHLEENSPTDTLFDLDTEGLKTVLRRLHVRTGIKCNAHSFRRGFATELRRKGLSELDIAELGRWSSTEMVQRYSRAYTFQDAATRYKAIV